MKVFHALLLSLVLCGSASVAADNAFPAIVEVVQKEGELAWSDGSSYYVMKKDGSFQSGPLGMGGRTIEGRWTSSGNLVTVTGRWSWLNGLSANDDFRKMRFGLSPTWKLAVVKPLDMAQVEKFHEVYFEVEELVKVAASGK